MNTRARIARLEKNLGNVKPTAEAFAAAGERFEKTGDLPSDAALSQAVVQEVLAQRHPDLRRQLLVEAVHENEIVRLPARAALRILVAAGGDIHDPALVPYDVPEPRFGTVGLMLLGWPEVLVHPPYEEQAQRLLVRLARLRSRVPKNDKAWLQAAADAVADFAHDGELPGEGMIQEFVLADVEMLCLMAHRCGRGDAEVIAAFDRAAMAVGQEREAALGDLRELARRGRVLAT